MSLKLNKTNVSTQIKAKDGGKWLIISMAQSIMATFALSLSLFLQTSFGSTTFGLS